METNEGQLVKHQGISASVIIISSATLLLHFINNIMGGYGYFRDELYYLACTEHPAAGYVDQPPLSIYVLTVSRLTLGDSIFALRLLPAVALTATVFMTGLMAREMGGGKFGQGISSLASALSSIFIAYGSVYSMNAFDVLVWTLAAYLLIKLINTESNRYWPIIGVVIGLGLLNKTGALWLGAGIAAGITLTPARGWLRTRWPYLAAAIALVLFLPYLVWNITHGFPHLEFILNATQGKYSGQTPASFLAGQILVQNPSTLPVWVAGLVFLFFHPGGRRYRLLGIVYITALLILLINQHSKPEYLSPAYGALFAAGGVYLEKLVNLRSFRWIRIAAPALVAVGILFIPATLPILPIETYIRYADALGIQPSTAEGKRLAELPQFYADRFGWEEKVAAVAKVYHALPDVDRKRCAIYAGNYGRCASIDFFGPALGLPKSIGRHNSYWLWGSRDYTGECVIVLGGNHEDKLRIFEHVDILDTVRCRYSMPYENNLPIYLCRNLKIPPAQAWALNKVYD